MYVTEDKFESQISALIEDMNLMTKNISVLKSIVSNLQKEDHLYHEYRPEEHAKVWGFLNTERCAQLMHDCHKLNIDVDFVKGCMTIMDKMKQNKLNQQQIEAEWDSYIVSEMEKHNDQ